MSCGGAPRASTVSVVSSRSEVTNPCKNDAIRACPRDPARIVRSSVYLARGVVQRGEALRRLARVDIGAGRDEQRHDPLETNGAPKRLTGDYFGRGSRRTEPRAMRRAASCHTTLTLCTSKPFVQAAWSGGSPVESRSSTCRGMTTRHTTQLRRSHASPPIRSVTVAPPPLSGRMRESRARVVDRPWRPR